jgi:hypothetical protein
MSWGTCYGNGDSCMSGGGKRKKKCMRGGFMSSLSPASLTGDSFDRDGAALAKAAHNLYVRQNYELASIKNLNAMAGGGKKKRSKTAKKYRGRGQRQRGGILELGALVNEAAVPFTLLAAQQRYKKRGTKGYRGTKRRKSFRTQRRRGRSQRGGEEEAPIVCNGNTCT